MRKSMLSRHNHFVLMLCVLNLFILLSFVFGKASGKSFPARNSFVAPLQSDAYMVLKNLDNFPANDQLAFSLIQIPWRRTSPTVTAYNANHDRVKLRISSKGTGTLTINNLTLSNASAWKIVSVNTDSTIALPVHINTGAFADVTIQFKAQNAASRVKVFNDTLSIISNDSNFPLKKVILRGLWQYKGEGGNEPYGQEIIKAFGFKSITGFNHDDGSVNGTQVIPNSSEISASYFVRADNNKPVSVYQMAAYHGCCAATETFKYFAKGSSTLISLFTHLNLDGQSLLPRLKTPTTSLAQGTFVPTGSFGFKVATSSSDRTQNFSGLIGLRILKAYDLNGNVIPNAYLVNMDYVGGSSNYDYNDNIYYVENIRPETGSPNYSDLISVTSSAVNFNPTLVGSNVSVNITLENLGITYTDNTSDPAIQLKSVKISGPNANEFSVGALNTTTLAVQATTPLNVKFAPNSAGIKNAFLLVSYNNASTPLRIPLYGIANSSTSTVSIAKRIKSGADANVTIGGNVYEADLNYRKGSIKLDKQTVTTGVAGTDIDLLYQTYLSAATDLAETSYEIPITNGSYMIRMHFVENFFTTAGSRVFGASIENQLVINNFDINSEAGYRTALVKDFSATVSDQILNIKFTPAVNRLALAGVEIFKVTNSGQRMAAAEDGVTEATEKKISIYPNPSSGNNISLNVADFGTKETLTVSVTSNFSGRILHTETFVTDDSGGVNIFLNLRNSLTSGIYIITIQSKSGITRSKLLVE